MASRGFFSFDPFDYFTAPQQTASAAGGRSNRSRFIDDLFPFAWDAEPPVEVLRPRAPATRKSRDRETAERPVSIPIRVDSPDTAPKRERKQRAEPAARAAGKRDAPSAEVVAAVRVQAAARGFLARRWVRAVRLVEREAEAVGRMVGEEEVLRRSDRARAAAAEVLMKMLLRLDAVRGAREYRRRVTRRVLALQDAVDALEQLPKAAAAPRAQAAVRVQAAARGFLARGWVRAVRQVEREAEAVGRIVGEKEEALRGSDRARAAAAEVLMKMLLRLDAVRGAREYRRRVTRRVLSLQEAVDALEQPKAAPAPEEPEEAQAEAAAADEIAEDSELASVLATQDSVDALETKPEDAQAAAAEATVVEIAEENGELAERSDADAAEDTGVVGLKADGGSAHSEPEATEEVDDGKPDCSDAEWEIVAEEPAEAEPVAAASPDEAAPRQEPAGLEFARAADSGAAGVVHLGNVMEMVALLCELNAQQCAVIAALAERVDALEWRMADAEHRAEKPSGEAGKQPQQAPQRLRIFD